MTEAERRSGNSFRVLRHRDFAIFWSAAVVSNTGSWMQTVTVPFVVYQMTRSTTWLGFAAFMNFIPAMIAGPIGGSYADRHSRKKILLVTQTIMMIDAFALWAVWVSGIATPGLIVGMVFVAGFVGGVNIATWQAFVTQLVDPDEIVDAVRLNTMQFTGARAVGPALAGIVLQTLGPAAAFFANGVSFLLVLGALVVIHPHPQVFSRDEGHVWAHLREGLRVVRSRQGLFLPILMIAVMSFLATSVIQLAPAVAHEEFDVGRGAYALLLAAFGVGTIIGAVTIAFFADRYRRSVAARIGMTGLSVGIVALGLAPTYGLGVASMLLMGIMYVLVSVSMNTTVQARVEDEFRARVVAIYLAGLMLGAPLGALVEGKLASVVDLRVVIVGSGIALALFLLYVMLRFDGMRALDESLVEVPTDPLLETQPAIAGAD